MAQLDYITDEDKIDSILKQKQAVILKHSTRCPISASAKIKFDRFAEKHENDITGLYIVDVIMKRELSLVIAEKTGIPHMSPQVIVLKDGKVVYTTSHWDINEESIEQALGA